MRKLGKEGGKEARVIHSVQVPYSSNTFQVLRYQCQAVSTHAPSGLFIPKNLLSDFQQ
jgi:hypothetical protein